MFLINGMVACDVLKPGNWNIHCGGLFIPFGEVVIWVLLVFAVSAVLGGLFVGCIAHQTIQQLRETQARELRQRSEETRRRVQHLEDGLRELSSRSFDAIPDLRLNPDRTISEGQGDV